MSCNEEHELANASDMHHEKMYTGIAVSQERFKFVDLKIYLKVYPLTSRLYTHDRASRQDTP